MIKFVTVDQAMFNDPWNREKDSPLISGELCIICKNGSNHDLNRYAVIREVEHREEDYFTVFGNNLTTLQMRTYEFRKLFIQFCSKINCSLYSFPGNNPGRLKQHNIILFYIERGADVSIVFINFPGPF